MLSEQNFHQLQSIAHRKDGGKSSQIHGQTWISDQKAEPTVVRQGLGAQMRTHWARSNRGADLASLLCGTLHCKQLALHVLLKAQVNCETRRMALNVLLVLCQRGVRAAGVVWHHRQNRAPARAVARGAADHRHGG